MLFTREKKQERTMKGILDTLEELKLMKLEFTERKKRYINALRDSSASPEEITLMEDELSTRMRNIYDKYPARTSSSYIYDTYRNHP